ncbi:MAG: hypothetical protein ACR2NP_14075 [Pirellulaceae bacterium]
MNRKIKFRMPDRDRDDTDRDESWPAAGRHFSPTPRSMLGGSAGLRLVILCLMLVMVLWAMSYAGRPESWNWLFKFDKVNVPAGVVAGDGAEPPAGDFRQPAIADDKSADDPSWQVASGKTLEELEQEFWKKVLRRLDGDEQVTLFTLVSCAVRQTAAPAGSTATFSPLWSRVRRWRRDYHMQWQEQAADIEAFQPLVDRWSESVVPAARAVIEDKLDESLASDALQEVAADLSESAASLIEDSTPVSRPREAYAWFDAWSAVFDSPIGKQTQNEVSVTQLLAQPAAYRGQNILVAGTALRVERVPASHNSLGIEQYHVVWIKPDHPSSFPWCVYTLVLPESLRCGPDETMKTAEQPVVANARFFKNRLFNADGSAGAAAVAPVLMTANLEIPADPNRAGGNSFRMPGRSVIWLSLGLIAGLAGLIAWTVYRSTLGGRTRALPREEQLQTEFAELEKDQRIETVSEKLKRLGQADVDDAQD